MHRYSRRPTFRLARCFMLWVNGLMPFLWPARHLLRHFNFFKGLAFYWTDYFKFARQTPDPRFPLHFVDSHPSLFDRFEQSGVKPRHYFHQDLWAAQKVHTSGVTEHFDLGSRIDGFVAHCAVFCKIVVFDIRVLQPLTENIHFAQADITNLGGVASGSLSSLSSLHVFEHIGLGRYGDPVGPHFLELAIREVVRALAPGGNFYFAVPVGMQRLEFNAQRIFAVRTVLEMFHDLSLVEFSAITDADDLIRNADPSAFDDAEYSCGLFHFRKS